MPILGVIASSKFIAPAPGVSFDSIATYTLSSNTTITFSSIPQTYKHLQLRVYGKTTRPTYVNDEIALRFNGDTGNNYSSHSIYSDGSTREANATASYSMIYYGGNIGSTVLQANTFGSAVIDILDYTNTSKNTTTRSISGFDNNGSGVTGFKSGLWLNTAAVTQIYLRGGEGINLATGTKVALYGIKG